VSSRPLLELCAELIDAARAAGADAAEAIVTAERTAEAHVENGEVHTAQTAEETTFGLRVLKDGSFGFATANATDPATCRGAAEDAVVAARATPPDPLNDFPPPRAVCPVSSLCDPRVARIDVESTTALAADMLDRVRQADRRVRVDSGGVTASVATTALASTSGVSVSESQAIVQGHLFGMAVDGEDVASFDYDGDATRDFARIGALLTAAADRFVDKCLAGLGAGKGRSFKGDVVLSPEAVAEFLVPTLTAALSADAVRRGRSPLAGKRGTRIAVPALNLVDDGSIAGGVASSAFDREGTPVSRHVLVQEGVLCTYLYNHYEALAAGQGTASTGHASGSAAMPPTIGPTFLELEGGDTASEDLLSAEGPCVYVARFSGSTNPVTGDFSGVVKNGALIEGASRQPLREVLIAGNLYEALKRIAGISLERRLIGGTRLVPMVRLSGISITAG
jgi:PmbA protein